MDTSTPKDLISPQAAADLWAELLPDPPESGTALLRRTERGTGPPSHLVDGPGTGRRMYSAEEVREWCLSKLGQRARLGIDVLRLVFLAGVAGYGVTLSAAEGDDPPAAEITDRGGAHYSGGLEGARRWLERAVNAGETS